MAKLETLQDDFNDGVIDPRWTVTSDLTYIETTALDVTCNASSIFASSFSISESGITYDFTNSYATLDINFDSGAGGSARLKIVTSGRNTIEYIVKDATISGQLYGSDVFSISYSPTNHRVIRFREDAGTLYFDASPDGITYSTLYSTANPFDTSDVKFSIDVTSNFPSSGNKIHFKYLNHTYVSSNPSVNLRGKCKLRGKVKIR